MQPSVPVAQGLRSLAGSSPAVHVPGNPGSKCATPQARAALPSGPGSLRWEGILQGAGCKTRREEKSKNGPRAVSGVCGGPCCRSLDAPRVPPLQSRPGDGRPLDAALWPGRWRRSPFCTGRRPAGFCAPGLSCASPGRAPPSDCARRPRRPPGPAGAGRRMGVSTVGPASAADGARASAANRSRTRKDQDGLSFFDAGAQAPCRSLRCGDPGSRGPLCAGRGCAARLLFK